MSTGHKAARGRPIQRGRDAQNPKIWRKIHSISIGPASCKYSASIGNSEVTGPSCFPLSTATVPAAGAGPCGIRLRRPFVRCLHGDGRTLPGPAGFQAGPVRPQDHRPPGGCPVHRAIQFAARPGYALLQPGDGRCHRALEGSGSLLFQVPGARAFRLDVTAIAKIPCDTMVMRVQAWIAVAGQTKPACPLAASRAAAWQRAVAVRDARPPVNTPARLSPTPRSPFPVQVQQVQPAGRSAPLPNVLARTPGQVREPPFGITG